MGTILTTTTESKLFDLIKREFTYLQESFPLEAETLYIKDIVGNNSGTSKRYAEAGSSRFSHVKPEGEDTVKTSAGLGYEKIMYVKRYAAERDVTFEFENWNQNPQIADFLKDVSEQNLERYDLDLTHRLTFCDATTYTNMDGEVVDITTGDGYALAYAAHTLANSATTFSNIVSGAPRFSQGAFLLAQDVANSYTYDTFGNPRRMNFNTVITSYDPATCYDVKQVLGSDSDIDASHSGVLNVNKRAFKHISLYNLDTDANGVKDTSKSKRWFYAAIGNGRMNSWNAFVGIWEANHMAPINEDKRKDIKSLGSRMSYGIAVLAPQGFIASLAS